jgi:hypothetical protein
MTDRSSVALRNQGARGTAGTPAGSDALENLITNELSDGAEAFIAGNRATYRWKPGDQATPLLGDKILPAPNDAGRWNEQGGEAVLERVLTSELASDVVVGSGLTVELLQIVVQAPGRCLLTMLGDLSATWTNTGDLELQVFVSVDGGAFTEVNAGAVQSGANNERRVVSVGATFGPTAVATQTVAVSLRLRNGLASGVTVSPGAGNAASLRVEVRSASVGTLEPGLLWYTPATTGSNVMFFATAAYLPNQLEGTVSTMPEIVVASPTAQNALWRMQPDPIDPTKVWFLIVNIGSGTGGYLGRYSRDDLAQDGQPKPEVICELNPVRASANNPISFSFLPGIGKCAVVTTGTIRVYDIASLVTGVPVPTAIITVAGATSIQSCLADSNDNLWVTSYAGSFAFRLSAAQLQGAGGVTVPPIILTGSNMAGGIEGLDFDADGNLWIAFYDSNEARKYSAASIAVSGNPVPVVIIDINNFATGALDVAVDDDGNIFVSNFDTGLLNKFTAAQLTTSGSKAPSLVLQTDLLIGVGGFLTFDRGTP